MILIYVLYINYEEVVYSSITRMHNAVHAVNEAQIMPLDTLFLCVKHAS